MNEKQFQSLARMAKTMQGVDADRSDFWRGFQRGLRRLCHGENFGNPGEHERWLNCRRDEYRLDLQTGYRAGYYHEELRLDSGEDIRPLRKLLGLSVLDLAEIASVSPRTVEGWEQGRDIPEPILKLFRQHFVIP